MEENTVLLPLEINDKVDLANFLNSLIQLPNEMLKDAATHNKLLSPNERLMLFRTVVRVWRKLQPQPRYFDTIDALYAYDLGNAGYSMQDIAEVLGRSKSSVCEYLNKIK